MCWNSVTPAAFGGVLLEAPVTASLTGPEMSP